MPLTPLLISFATATLVLLIAHSFAPRLSLLDQPSARKQHIGAVPLVGGISIFVGLWSGLAALSPVLDGLSPLFIASLLLLLVGVQDDRFGLAVRLRFLVESIAILILMLAGGMVLHSLGDLFGFGVVQLDWFAYPFTVIAVVGVVNALNMVDGIDGLAGSLTLIALSLMGGLAWAGGRATEGWVALLLAVAMLPYLLCNLKIFGAAHRVFLGDSGSMLLGLVVAWLAISLSQPAPSQSAGGHSPLFAPVTALWLFAVPVVDTVAIIVRRLLKGQSPYLPDRDHLHHVVMRMGYRDRHALLFISLLAVVLAGFGLWMEFAGVAESVRFALFLWFLVGYMLLLQHIWRVVTALKRLKASLPQRVWQRLSPLTALPVQLKQVLLLLVDGVLIYATLVVAIRLHHGSWQAVESYFGGPVGVIFWLAPLLAYPLMGWFGLYRSVIRTFGAEALWAVTGAVALYGLISMGALFLLSAGNLLPRSEQIAMTVLVLHLLLLLLFIGGVRLVARKLLSHASGGHLSGQAIVRRSVVIVGAGDAGRQLGSALRQSHGFRLVGFVEDDDHLQGRILFGQPVISRSELPAFVNRHQVSDLLLADERLEPASARGERNQMLAQLLALPVRVRVMPRLEALASGSASWHDIDEPDVADLLQRPPPLLDQPLLNRQLAGKTVLVLGAGGVIGGELCRQLLDYRPALLLIHEQNEQDLQQIHEQLLLKIRAAELGRGQRGGSGVDSLGGVGSVGNIRILPRVVPLLAAVEGYRGVTELMQTWHPDQVYLVEGSRSQSMVERNMVQGVRHNLFSMFAVVKSAIEQRVPGVVLLSNEAAAAPGSTLGAIQRVSEMVIQSLMAEHHPLFRSHGEPAAAVERTTQLATIRLGEVLQVSDPLITRLRREIENGGPVVLDGAHMDRHLLTLEEAAHLLLQTGSLASVTSSASSTSLEEGNQPTALFETRAGETVNLARLARRMVELSGLRVKVGHEGDEGHGDIEIQIKGASRDIAPPATQQPDEQPDEQLDKHHTTQQTTITLVDEPYPPWEQLQEDLLTLQTATENGDVEMIRELLKKLVKGYQPKEKITDWTYLEQINQ